MLTSIFGHLISIYLSSAYLSLCLKQNTVRCFKLEKLQKKVKLITHELYPFCAELIQHGFRYERKSVKFEGIPKVATPALRKKKSITRKQRDQGSKVYSF